MMLEGKLDNSDVVLAIVDHPENEGYPTYWHARGYGLFSANPLGQSVFSEGKEVLNFTLLPNQSVTFKYRFLVKDGLLSKQEMQKISDDFVTKH